MTIKESLKCFMKVKRAKSSFLVTGYFFSDLLRTLLTPKSTVVDPPLLQSTKCMFNRSLPRVFIVRLTLADRPASSFVPKDTAVYLKKPFAFTISWLSSWLVLLMHLHLANELVIVCQHPSVYFPLTPN